MRQFCVGVVLLVSFFCRAGFGLETAYVHFDDPEGWGCDFIDRVWICQSKDEVDRKDGVVLAIAALATEWDNLKNYQDYLKTPRTISDELKGNLTSEISYVRTRNIRGVDWVDSLQHNSELPGFWARYLATVHQIGDSKLAILISYIVADDKYQKFAPLFERMIASLKPSEKLDLKKEAKMGKNEIVGAGEKPDTSRIISERLNLQPRDTTANAEDAPDQTKPLLFGLAGALAVGYLVMRIRRKKTK